MKTDGLHNEADDESRRDGDAGEDATADKAATAVAARARSVRSLPLNLIMPFLFALSRAAARAESLRRRLCVPTRRLELYHILPLMLLVANEIFDLVECVRRAESPFADVNADAIGFPVKVCEGVYLWRLTAGASAWLDAYESFFACSSIQSS